MQHHTAPACRCLAHYVRRVDYHRGECERVRGSSGKAGRKVKMAGGDAGSSAHARAVTPSAARRFTEKKETPPRGDRRGLGASLGSTTEGFTLSIPAARQDRDGFAGSRQVLKKDLLAVRLRHYHSSVFVTVRPETNTQADDRRKKMGLK